MKKLLLTTIATGSLLLTAAQANAAEHFTLDPAHTNIVWKANHLGFSSPSGKFVKVEGNLTLDQSAPQNSAVNVTIYPASIVTGNDKFDGHLSSADFFNVEAFPKAEFKSTSITKTGEETADIHGELTMLGMTKPLTLQAKLNKVGPNPFTKDQTAGFSATGVIKRSEYGIAWGLPNIGDEVIVEIETEFIKK